MLRTFSGIARDIRTIRNVAITWLALSIAGTLVIGFIWLMESGPRQVGTIPAVETMTEAEKREMLYQQRKQLEKQRKDISDLIRQRDGR